MWVFAVPTLVSGDEGDVFGSRRHTEYLVAVNLALYLRQVSKGAGDTCWEVWNMTHLHQQLCQEKKNAKQSYCDVTERGYVVRDQMYISLYNKSLWDT